MIREGRTLNSNKRGRISCPGPLYWQGASIYLSVSPSFCLSVSPSSCPSDSLSLPIPICLHVFLSVCPSVFMSVSLFMSLYLSVSLSLYLSVYLSFCLSVCISVSVSQRNFLLYLYLSVSLSFHLLVSLYLCSCLPIFQSLCLLASLSVFFTLLGIAELWSLIRLDILSWPFTVTGRVPGYFRRGRRKICNPPWAEAFTSPWEGWK